MKNKLALSAVSAALLLSSHQAVAFDTGTGYVGAQYAMATYSESGIPDFDTPLLMIRGGYFFNKYFSLEGRLGFGIGDDTQNVFGFDVTLELDNMYGVYGVGHLPVSERVDLYGLVGYSKGEGTLTISGIPGSDSGDESDLSLGVGADFLLTDAFSINIEYTSYISKSEFDIDALALGVNYYF
jgi:opacity protein-like surface antigen